MKSMWKMYCENVLTLKRITIETSETFQAYFGCYNFLRIVKTKMFPGMKVCNKFALSYLKIILEYQLSRISGSCFKKWLFRTFEKQPLINFPLVWISSGLLTLVAISDIDAGSCLSDDWNATLQQLLLIQNFYTFFILFALLSLFSTP